jgi:thiosulfate/3-mercaptopyruvate sulfurtransferase
MTMTRSFHLTTLIAATLTLASGQTMAAGPLSTFAEVQAKLDSPNLRLLDVRPRPEYDKGHAPGAVWVDSKAAQTLAGRPGGLTDRAAWEAWIAPLAIGPKTEVLIFDGAKQLDAARLWWLLSYLGVEHVGLIDGNFPLWKSKGKPVTMEAANIKPVPFSVTFLASHIATRQDVLTSLKSGEGKVVDARSVEEYTGEKKSSKRGGHIPAACRLEWTDLVDKDGVFLEESALKVRLDALGIKPGEPVITHCQGGGRASVDAFAIGRLGHPTRNFYLGWSDWGNADETPVTEGTKP